jgi:DNA-binding NtrC family response regulator
MRSVGMPTGKIMIVDDEQDVREAIKLQLAGKNLQILEAGDGAEAIAAIKSEDHMTNVGLILCDIRMPNVDGVECIDYLKAEAPGIPIVVITAFPDTELAVSLMKKGVKEYLVKPVDKEKLISVVDKLISAGKDVGL